MTPISGGSTTQSGIYYQNTIAALYLGRMLDPRISDLTQKVLTVRSEAREYVDDIVVLFADGHRRFIQVKENIEHTQGNKKWQKLWEDFEKQCWDAEFKDEDRLVIFLGNLEPWFTNLNSLCERARGVVNLSEWQDVLGNQALGKLEAEVRQLLSPEHQNLADSLKLLSLVDVEQKPLDILESLVPAWMPPNNKGEQALFSSLRDLCGINARNKVELDESTLRTRLKNSFGIEIFPAPIAKESNRLKGSILFEDGRPVEGACVRVIGLDLDQVITGPSGFFEFVVEAQPTWTIQASYKEMSTSTTVEQARMEQPVLIKFPLLASFSIDSPVEDEEIPLGANQMRTLEGSFPILTSYPKLAETAKVAIDVFQFPEGNAIKQKGRLEIFKYQGKWYFISAKFSGEGLFDIIATATVGKDKDSRKVRVNCVGKGKYYQQTIEEDRKYRGIHDISFQVPVEIDLGREKQALYPMQVNFFKYYFAHDYDNAMLTIDRAFEILDRVLPLFPEDLELQNLRAYMFKNMSMVLRDLHRDDEFYRALSEAEKMFKAIRDQDPNDAGAWNGLGSIALLRGEYQKALAYIEKALEINPNYEEAKNDRETTLNQLKRGQ